MIDGGTAHSTQEICGLHVPCILGLLLMLYYLVMLLLLLLLLPIPKETKQQEAE